MSGRESHDSSAYYARNGYHLDSKDQVLGDMERHHLDPGHQMILGDSRHMDEIPDNSIALMVTSPPYGVGKDYDDTDQSFDEYIDLLHDVFTETYRVLEPGGRAAINVANLGRKPYIPLTSYVHAICMDIGYLPRGEIIWVKGEGAAGNCAWGTFNSPKNPVLRDLHEYVLVYSKEQFGKPFKGESTLTKEEFMEYTLSIWKIRPESAKKIGHPAPFPLELPRRLIKLYTYQDEHVLDPFVGSGTTTIAAMETGRSSVGYDNDQTSFDLASNRIAEWSDTHGS